jgi:hypothetical protein
MQPAVFPNNVICTVAVVFVSAFTGAASETVTITPTAPSGRQGSINPF